MLARDDEIARLATAAERWSCCGKSARSPTTARSRRRQHADLVGRIYRLPDQRDGRIPEDWIARRSPFDRTDGDIDTLSNRIAHIRTWTFVANRPDWLADRRHWQSRAREIEDRLSDALHERLTQRFIDRRTSVLMRRLGRRKN